MIRTKHGETMIKGNLTEIRADLTVIIRAFRNTLSKDFTEDCIEKFVADAVELSKKDEDEVNDIAVDALLKFLGGVL